MEASEARSGDQPTVLVAIEPRACREVIGKAIEILRPNLAVKAVEPGMLDAELSRTNPILVLCDGTMDASIDGVLNRVMFRHDQSAASVHMNGRQAEIERIDLNELLAIVDRVVSSIQDNDAQDESKVSDIREW